MDQLSKSTPNATSSDQDGDKVSFDHDALRDKMAAALDAVRPRPPASAASMAVELRANIIGALARGCTLADVAQIMTDCGLPTTADAVRVALRRNILTKAARTRKARDRKATMTKGATSSAPEIPAQPELRVDGDPNTGLHLD